MNQQPQPQLITFVCLLSVYSSLLNLTIFPFLFHSFSFCPYLFSLSLSLSLSLHFFLPFFLSFSITLLPSSLFFVHQQPVGTFRCTELCQTSTLPSFLNLFIERSINVWSEGSISSEISTDYDATCLHQSRPPPQLCTPVVIR